MSHRFREVRKGERDAVLAFAKQHGCTIEPDRLHHHLSLAVETDEGAMLAAALCVQGQTGQPAVEIVTADAAPDEALVTELADRCLRKVQAEDIAAVRLHSPSQAPAEVIWSNANWLDRIDEAAPPDAANPDTQAA